jgi:hypothetical protein
MVANPVSAMVATWHHTKAGFGTERVHLNFNVIDEMH